VFITNGSKVQVTLNQNRIESVEIVIGTGMFSEMSSGIDDFFGMRSTAFEQKLAKAKDTAFKKLKLISF
jgi:uncharacterized protein YbjQ (UPF0145 family)